MKILTACIALAAVAGGAAVPAPAQQRDHNLLTADEISKASVPNAYQAIEKLRSDWLRRGQLQKTLRSGRNADGEAEPAGQEVGTIRVAVFIDGNEAGGARELERISADQVQEMRYLSGADAATQYGPRFVAGVINVRLKSGTGRGAALATTSPYRPPACSAAKVDDQRIRDAASALREGTRKSSPARDTLLDQAKSKLVEALGRGGKGTDAAWVYLGQVYLYQGDLRGADSAFTRAASAVPDCKDDIARAREAAWLPLVNSGIELANGNKPDSAKGLLHNANLIYREKPTAFVGLGTIYANEGRNDSAIVYLKKAVEVADAAKELDERNVAQYNLGLVLMRAKRYDEAVTALEQLRTWQPKDSLGGKALASAYRGAGKVEQAQALEKQLGITVAEVPGGNTGDQFKQAIALFEQQKYAEAATLFGQIFEKQPFNHDALLNQATAYFRLKDGPKLTAASQKLVELEPLNEIALQLLAQGYKLAKQQDKQVATMTRVFALPVRVETRGVTISPTELQLTLAAIGRQARDAKSTPLKPAPVNLTFEMLGADGSVIATQETGVPALTPDATHELKVNAKADGIVGWRYKVK